MLKFDLHMNKRSPFLCTARSEHARLSSMATRKWPEGLAECSSLDAAVLQNARLLVMKLEKIHRVDSGKPVYPSIFPRTVYMFSALGVAVDVPQAGCRPKTIGWAACFERF